MSRNKALDQLLLLAAAVALIAGIFWLIDFMEGRGASERMGFFILTCVLVAFITTWNGVAWFRRTPRFWLFHTVWIVLHTVISITWAYSGKWVELCVVTAPLESYLYYRLGKYRLQRGYSIAEPSGA